MNPEEINHFLVEIDPTIGEVNVRSFGTDYDAAQDAYAAAERERGVGTAVDVVLISADSLETIKRTHSSYFTGNKSLRDLLPT